MTGRVHADWIHTTALPLPYPEGPVAIIEFSSPIGWSAVCGSLIPSGMVRLRFKGQEAIGEASGNDSIDGLFKAMMNAAKALRVFPHEETPELVALTIQRRPQTSSAPGVVRAVLAYHGKQATVEREDANTINGCIFTFLQCLNILACDPAVHSRRPRWAEGAD